MNVKRLFIPCACLILASCSTVPKPTQSTSHSAPTNSPALSISNKNLWSYVDKDGQVDYSALVQSPAAINNEYTKIAASSPDSHPKNFPTKNDRLAYWLNAYNVSVIYSVTQLYPIESVQDHRPFSAYSLISGGGFFAAQKFTYGGKRHSLYTVENKIIRKRFDDPRIHFGLNCASASCPDLAQTPFKAETLDQHLEQLTKDFINSPKGVVINHETKEIQLSAIFKWYEKDFQPNAITYIIPHLKNSSELSNALHKGYSISYLPYDWSLNKQ